MRKPTKHVLLATTALALSAGVAAADFSTSATAKLTYGNFGTGNFRAGYANRTFGEVAPKDNNGLTKPGVAYEATTAAAAPTTVFSAADKAAGDKARTAAEKKRKIAGSPTAAETAAENDVYVKAVQNNRALRQKAADAKLVQKLTSS